MAAPEDLVRVGVGHEHVAQPTGHQVRGRAALVAPAGVGQAEADAVEGGLDVEARVGRRRRRTRGPPRRGGRTGRAAPGCRRPARRRRGRRAGALPKVIDAVRTRSSTLPFTMSHHACAVLAWWSTAGASATLTSNSTASSRSGTASVGRQVAEHPLAGDVDPAGRQRAALADGRREQAQHDGVGAAVEAVEAPRRARAPGRRRRRRRPPRGGWPPGRGWS